MKLSILRLLLYCIIDLLFIVAPGICGDFVCNAVLTALSSFAIILPKKKELVILLCALLSCYYYCSVFLPNSGVGWPVVCDCGISRSYSLAFR